MSDMTLELEAALQRRRQLSASPVAVTSTENSPLVTRDNVSNSAGLSSSCSAAPRLSPTCEPSMLRRGAVTKSVSTTPSHARRSAEIIQRSPSAYTKVSVEPRRSRNDVLCMYCEIAVAAPPISRMAAMTASSAFKDTAPNVVWRRKPELLSV